ncbi:MAG TPA: gfo/Idh/MocA family oxidoreductase, partial [Planctomycetota bacterium]|nr:gfo/Idh/MocA family oxidoreductase [Planctomycetota bacterium]
MRRRKFLKATLATLLAPAAARTPAVLGADTLPRVGLIGTGWYGKCDLFRLIQVAPIEVVSL